MNDESQKAECEANKAEDPCKCVFLLEFPFFFGDFWFFERDDLNFLFHIFDYYII